MSTLLYFKNKYKIRQAENLNSKERAKLKPYSLMIYCFKCRVTFENGIPHLLSELLVFYKFELGVGLSLKTPCSVSILVYSTRWMHVDSEVHIAVFNGAYSQVNGYQICNVSLLG